MAETFTQVPPDSTGDKLHMRERVRGADTVLQQAVFLDEAPTYLAMADAVAFAANKNHICLYNTAGTGVVLKVHDIRFVNLALAAVTGVGLRFEVRRTGGVPSAGTDIAEEKFDTGDANLPAGVVSKTNATITDGTLLWPIAVNNDEIALTLSQQSFAGQSIVPGPMKAKLITLREGEGIAVKQVTTSVVGSFAWLVVFSAEPTHTA